jgi:hypothetical protein
MGVGGLPPAPVSSSKLAEFNATELPAIGIVSVCPSVFRAIGRLYLDHVKDKYGTAFPKPPFAGVPSTPGDLPPLHIPDVIPKKPGAPLEDFPTINPLPEDLPAGAEDPIFLPPNIPEHPWPVEDFPTIPDFWSKLSDFWDNLSGAALDTFDATIEYFQKAFDFTLQELKVLLPNWADAIKYFLYTTADKLVSAFDAFGLLGLLKDAVDIVDFASSLIVEALRGVASVFEVCFFFVRILAFLLQDYTEWHGPDHVYRRSLIRGDLEFHTARMSYSGTAMTVGFATSVDLRYEELAHQAAAYGTGNNIQATITGSVTNKYAQILANIDQLPQLHMPQDSSTEMLALFSGSFPEYSVVKSTTTAPHAHLAAIRFAFRNRANEYLAVRGRPVLSVGASITEMASINRHAHNCAPILSGRDQHRYMLRVPNGPAVYSQVCHNHKFEDCSHTDAAGSTFGHDVWSFFSAHDITPEKFIRAMVANASDTAVVALHLPFPLLDRNVRQYTDLEAGLHYERVDDKLLVYHLGSKSAGYAHDFETVYSWMTNLPTFDNAHVQLEVIGQVGTAVLCVLTVAEGKQEIVPSIWSCQREDFYILPELLHTDLRKDDTVHFSVPARRFEQLVAYVATLDSNETTDSTKIAAKIRGMMAEIKVGKHQIEPRWGVTLPQFYSLIQHAVLAHSLHERSTNRQVSKLKGYYGRVARRNGGFITRYCQHKWDLVTWCILGETDVAHNSSLIRKLFSNGLDHTHTYNPYQRAGQYRLANLDCKYSDNVVSGSLVLRKVSKTFSSMNNWRKRALNYLPDTPPASPHLEAEPLPVRVKHIVPEETPPGTPKTGTMTLELNQLRAELENVLDGPKSTGSFSPTFSDDIPNALNDHIPTEVVFAPPDTPEESRPSSPSPVPSVRPAMGRPSMAVPPEFVRESMAALAEMPPVTGLLGMLPVAPEPKIDVSPPDPGEPIVQMRPAEIPIVDELREYMKTEHNYRTLAPVHWSQCAPRNMQFEGNYKNISKEHPADAAFAQTVRKTGKIDWHLPDLEIMCPTVGLVQVIDESLMHGTPRDCYIGKRVTAEFALVRSLTFGQMIAAPDPKAQPSALEKKTKDFVALAMKKPGALKMRTVLLDGPAMCGKSSAVRLWLKNKSIAATVVVPSNKLAKDWQDNTADLHLKPLVITRQSSRFEPQSTVIIFDEIYNFNLYEVEFHLRIAAAAGVYRALFLGDRYQREKSGLATSNHFFKTTIRMHTSLGMPRDAHALFTSMNRLDPAWFTTTGSLAPSVYAAPIPIPKFVDLAFTTHKYFRANTATVGQVQGLRADTIGLDLDGSTKQASWITEQLNRYSVAVTRHKRALFVQCNAATEEVIFQNMATVIWQPVNGFSQVDVQSPLKHNVIDDLVGHFKLGGKTAQRLSALRAVMQDPLAIDGHAIVLAQPEMDVADPVASPEKIETKAVEAIVHEKVQFALPDPNTIDLHLENNSKPFRFRDPGPPIQRTDVRNDIPESNNLAAIHSSQSGADNLKNLVERQIARTKSSHVGTADIQEGIEIYEHFKRCFYDKGAVLLTAEKALTWLTTRELNALQAVVNGEPFGETSKSLTVDAEFKTQTKAKAQESFAVTLPYGQSILANSKQFNAYFAVAQPLAYLNCQRLLRPGVILDYGLSDDELSEKIRTLGHHARLNGLEQIQADLSKQDSSHTAATLYAFLLVLRDAGVPEEQIDFYWQYCRKYVFLSRGVDACKASISFNLGSGDPFTLLRNDIMELCVLAVKYVHADSMFVVEKGDDVHGVIKSLLTRSLAAYPSIAQCILTVDHSSLDHSHALVGYHAGRFHNGHRYLVDPIRAFFKHFTRLSDTTVSETVLYNSYVSRATDYSESEVEFLKAACVSHYPFFSTSQVTEIISTMLSLRDFSYFCKTSRIKYKTSYIAVDTRENCASNCVRAVLPGRSRAFYRQFEGLNAEALSGKLSEYAIPHCVTDGTPIPSVANMIFIGTGHARVKVDLTRLRRNL